MPPRRKYYLISSSKKSIFTIDERYLSVALDIGQIAEPTRFWNPDGSGETTTRPTFDFDRTRLVNLTSALAPAYLRIGGTEADRCFYALNVHNDKTPPPSPPYKSVLTAAHMDSAVAFAKRCGFELCLTLNAGRGARPNLSNDDAMWDSTQARELMRRYGRSGSISVFELGNEPNAYPLFHQNLTIQPEQYAADLAECIKVRDECAPNAKIAGPATAFWPTLGEVPALGWPKGAWRPTMVSNFLRRSLRAAIAMNAQPDIVTYHYYPGLSDRAGLCRQRPAASVAVAPAAIAAVAAVYAAATGGCGDAWTTRLAALVASLAFAVIAGLCYLIRFAVRPLSDPRSLQRVYVLDTVLKWAEHVRTSIREETRGSAVEEQPQGGGRRHRRRNSNPPPKPPPALWLGETGSAQVGGQPGVSGRWASTLWWLDQLGLLAARGHAVQVRQTLCGADYGLLDEATLSPTPEYWVSVLWKRLMGCDVYEVTCEPKPPPTLRLYCHGIQNEDYRTYLIINLDENEVELDFGMSPTVWIVQGESLASQTLTINGKTPLATKDGKLPSLLPRSNLFGPVLVPAGAAAFVEVETA